MLKAEMDLQLRSLHEITGAMLVGMRLRGTCRYCGAKVGQQHLDGCEAWLIIEWRQRNHALGLYGQDPFRVDVLTGTLKSPEEQRHDRS